MPDRQSALNKYREGRARAIYDTARAQGDDPRRQEILEHYVQFRAQGVAKLALKPGETVLDVGCGTGLSFSDLETGVAAEGRIIGIEQSPEQLTRARALIERSGWQNITLINSAVEDAQIPVGANAALFSFTHDILSTPRAVENVVKSLPPGDELSRWASNGRRGGGWPPTGERGGARGTSSPRSKDSASPGAIWQEWFHRWRLSR